MVLDRHQRGGEKGSRGALTCARPSRSTSGRLSFSAGSTRCMRWSNWLSATLTTPTSRKSVRYNNMFCWAVCTCVASGFPGVSSEHVGFSNGLINGGMLQPVRALPRLPATQTRGRFAERPTRALDQLQQLVLLVTPLQSRAQLLRVSHILRST